MTHTTKSNIVILPVNPDDYMDEVEAGLAVDDWRELESAFADKPPKLDKETYLHMWNIGQLVCLAAFDRAKIVGYSMAMIAQHAHYDMLFAQTDAIYLHKDYRKGRTGLKLISMTEQAAKDKGAEVFLWTAKPDTALHKLLERKNYRVEDILFSKRL